MNNFWRILILIVVSYMLGNINFARIWARTRNNDDITTHGSGNPGTMNVLRTHGVWLAVLTLVFDALKSIISCLGAMLWIKYTGGSEYLINIVVYACGLSCVLGHMYPVIYKFKGGKGVATALGFAAVAHPIMVPIILVSFLIVFFIWKMGSLASMTGVLVYTIIDSVMLLKDGYYASFIILLVIVSLIIYAHRGNIKRLFENKENKIDFEAVVQKDKDYIEEQKQKRLIKQKQKKEKDKTNKD